MKFCCSPIGIPASFTIISGFFPCLVTGALPNRRAVAESLLAKKHQQILILGSGWEGAYSLEDSLAAGAIAHWLVSAGASAANDECQAALGLWQQWKHEPEACLRVASHGQRLMRIGNHDADFSCCAGLDQISVVPTQDEPGVLRAVRV